MTDQKAFEILRDEIKQVELFVPKVFELYPENEQKINVSTIAFHTD